MTDTTVTRVPVLMYHRVGPWSDRRERRYCIEPAPFRSHMQALRDAGYRAVDLAAFLAWFYDGAALPTGAILITFDDGYLGVLEHAAPVLAEMRWPAVMFLVSGLIGGSDEWMRGTHPESPPHRLLDWSHCRQLRDAGFSLQSHSCTHADLPRLDDASLRQELADSRSQLEDGLGERVDCLAYPFGRCDARVEQAAQDAGYRAAFGTRSGFNRRAESRYALRRIDVFGTDSPAYLLRKLRLGSNDGSPVAAGRYYLGRLRDRLGV